MFSPPPGGTPRLRRNIRPYRLAPIQREIFIQEAISDSPFYSTSAHYTSENTSVAQVPSVYDAHQRTTSGGSSIPMLIMTDDGGEDWEVLSEVGIVTRVRLTFMNSYYM